MQTVPLKSWRAFHRLIEKELVRPNYSRNGLAFRGQASASWNLTTTLDRVRKFSTNEERMDFYESLRDEFDRESALIGYDPRQQLSGESFDLLARHHGVPSNLLDWTRSPYVAAYFAFEDASSRASSIAIWRLDLAELVDTVPDSSVRIIDETEMIRFNPRALRQQGLFTAIQTYAPEVEKVLGRAVQKITLPSDQRSIALASLDAMAINATTLYADLDGAARTAFFRVRN